MMSLIKKNDAGQSAFIRNLDTHKPANLQVELILNFLTDGPRQALMLVEEFVFLRNGHLRQDETESNVFIRLANDN
jgi:hypothetical protein